jgi:hypothetical protein
MGFVSCDNYTRTLAYNEIQEVEKNIPFQLELNVIKIGFVVKIHDCNLPIFMKSYIRDLDVVDKYRELIHAYRKIIANFIITNSRYVRFRAFYRALLS